MPAGNLEEYNRHVHDSLKLIYKLTIPTKMNKFTVHLDKLLNMFPVDLYVVIG